MTFEQCIDYYYSHILLFSHTTVYNVLITVCPQNYTQYIPLSVYELQSWLGSPSIYVYDCSNAGVLLKHFTTQGLWRVRYHFLVTAIKMMFYIEQFVLATVI